MWPSPTMSPLVPFGSSASEHSGLMSLAYLFSASSYPSYPVTARLNSPTSTSPSSRSSYFPPEDYPEEPASPRPAKRKRSFMKWRKSSSDSSGEESKGS